jgi:membrane protease subunit HflK
MQQQFNVGDFRLPNIQGKKLLYGVMGLLVLIILFSGVYTIDPEEVGVVLRFGRYVKTTSPGLNFKIPFGVEKVVKVPVQRQLKQEFGFRTKEPAVRTRYARSSNADAEALMLTGDLNSAVVEWIVQYKISDPVKFLFKVRNAEETFRNMSEAAMREVVGDRSVTDVLTVGREEIAAEAKQRLQELCNQYETGIDVKIVVLQDVNPPDPVKPSYNEVNQALQEKDKMINEAYAAYNQEIPRAKGEAERTIRMAEGYSMDRVNRAKGDAERFQLLYREYSLAKDVTRRRLYLETMIDVLPKVEKKIIVDEKQKGMIPLLQFGEGGLKK